MPAKNILKTYIENGYYHLYNRGVEKRIIFEEKSDYVTFLHFLKKYLTADPDCPHSPKTLYNRIDLLAYCLMPNHFHLLVKQRDRENIIEFIRKICTNYAMYFNKKYKRIGTLFQGRYKASLIDSNIYLLHLTRYIHQNPLEIIKSWQELITYPYSSYPNYLGIFNQGWIKPEEILTLLKEEFGPRMTYQNFMEDNKIVDLISSNINIALEENPAEE